KLVAERPGLEPFGQAIDHHETDVVTRVRVLRSGVAEPDDKLHSGHFLAGAAAAASVSSATLRCSPEQNTTARSAGSCTSPASSTRSLTRTVSSMSTFSTLI